MKDGIWTMAELLKLLAISLIPGILWVIYFHRKDIYDKEPARLVAKAFLAGAVMIIPAGLVEAPLRGVLTNPPSLPVLLLASVFGIGLVEEFFKYLAVRRTVYDLAEFNEPMDGIVYAVSAGLGFAAFENVLYAASYGLPVGIVRGALTSLVHASFSGIVGFQMGIAKFAPKSMEGPLVARGLMTASVLHGLYDFLLMTELMNFYLTLLVVVLLYVGLAGKIRTALHVSPFRFAELYGKEDGRSEDSVEIGRIGDAAGTGDPDVLSGNGRVANGEDDSSSSRR